MENYKINYKSDFELTLVSESGWSSAFSILFWATGATTKTYTASYDGETYANCYVDEDDSTILHITFDNHNLGIGQLMAIVSRFADNTAYASGVADSVSNPITCTIEVDGTTYIVVLYYTSDDEPDVTLLLPYKINYKSDFTLDITSDAGWNLPFSVEFWSSGALTRRYTASYDGTDFTNCYIDEDDSTILHVTFGSHDLGIGQLMCKITWSLPNAAYDSGVEEATSNDIYCVVTIGTEQRIVTLAFAGETGADLSMELPAMANEAARQEAEAERVEAEEARVEAEAARVTAEEGRVDAEALRVNAEAARVTAEEGRVNAEALRVSAESARVTAEAARVNAENLRVSAESARVTAEAARVNAENLRVSAESARVTAEQGRVDAEALRVSAEAARVNAENLRVNAESARVTAEQGRVDAEALRVSAEAGRVDAEETRETTFASEMAAFEDEMEQVDGIDTVSSEAYAQLAKEVAVLRQMVNGLVAMGNVTAGVVTLTDMPRHITGVPYWCQAEGAPSASVTPDDWPSDVVWTGAPRFIGQKYFDKTAGKEYTAYRLTNSVSDWK